MNKKILSAIAIVFVLWTSFLPCVSLADNASRACVEKLLAGEQDLLVFANIVSKDQYSYEVQVTEIIAPPTEEDDKDEKASNLVGQKISVEHFGGYMYFLDNSGIVPQLGDNVLLSLETAGNMFYVKNGAYKVDYASSELFSFIAPDIHTGASEIAELKALYLYVSNKDLIGDIIILDDSVYIKDVDGNEEEQEIFGGISLIDAEGELTENPDVVEPYSHDGSAGHESKWELAVGIIALGMAIGASCIIFSSKFEKRYDEN